VAALKIVYVADEIHRGRIPDRGTIFRVDDCHIQSLCDPKGRDEASLD